MLGLPQATVYRLFAMLEDEGVLQRIGDGKKVELSDRFLHIVVTGASDEQLVSGFRDCMAHVADSTKACAFLGRLSGKLVELVHVVTPTDRSAAYIHPGLNVRPAHACSSSRAILANLDDQRIAEITGTEKAAFTGKTLTSKKDILTELRLTKQRGYAVCDQEIDVGVTSVAIPVIVGRAGVVCSIGIVAATSWMHKIGLPSVAETLKDCIDKTVSGFNADQAVETV